MMVFGSVCSGIEAASAAWLPLGWRAAFHSEIAAFPRAVLRHHYPDVPLRGDFTEIQAGDHEAIDVLVGGTPCQSFSVAGLRGGMADARGNLALEYLRLAERLRPRWLVWENVPGVLSSNGGRDFGSFLGGMGNLGYGFAYRVLDAQFFGLAQRRKRVFVVGYLGDWRRAAAVLFEPACLRGDSAPRRQTREGVAPTISARPTGGGGLGTDFDLDGGLVQAAVSCADVSHTLSAARGAACEHAADLETFVPVAVGGNRTAGALDVATAVRAKGGTCHGDSESETFVTHALRADGFDASEDGTGRGTPLVPVAFRTSSNRGAWESGDRIDALTTQTDPTSHVIAFHENQRGEVTTNDTMGSLKVGGGKPSQGYPAVAFAIQERAVCENPNAGPDGAGVREGVAFTLEARSVPQSVAYGGVRRLTPRECERLQGFSDDFTLIPWRKGVAPDGPRYKALGNSMAVPCMAWIGRRIAMVDGGN